MRQRQSLVLGGTWKLLEIGAHTCLAQYSIFSSSRCFGKVKEIQHVV